MKIQQAIKSDKPFKRKEKEYWIWFGQAYFHYIGPEGNYEYNPTVQDILADDWEVQSWPANSPMPCLQKERNPMDNKQQDALDTDEFDNLLWNLVGEDGGMFVAEKKPLKAFIRANFEPKKEQSNDKP